MLSFGAAVTCGRAPQNRLIFVEIRTDFGARRTKESESISVAEWVRAKIRHVECLRHDNLPEIAFAVGRLSFCFGRSQAGHQQRRQNRDDTGYHEKLHNCKSRWALVLTA